MTERPTKDDTETAVPHVWRETLREIVASLVRGDRPIGFGVSGLSPVSDESSDYCYAAVRDYGSVTLVDLPEATWRTSVMQWEGHRWACLVDLWTEEEGRSDLVLEMYVVEQSDETYGFELSSVYVP